MITKEEVKHIAQLARIGVSEREVEKFSQDLSSVLDWVEELKEVDIRKAKEISSVSERKNALREDEPRKFSEADKLIDLFPEKEERYAKVKSVL